MHPPSSLPLRISSNSRRFSSTDRLRHADSTPCMRSCSKGRKTMGRVFIF